MPGFVIVRDARGSLVHARQKDDDTCVCIEAGLFEVVRSMAVEGSAGRRFFEGSSPPARAATPVDARMGRTINDEPVTAGGNENDDRA